MNNYSKNSWWRSKHNRARLQFKCYLEPMLNRNEDDDVNYNGDDETDDDDDN